MPPETLRRPIRPGNWPMITVTAIAFMKPSRMGLDNRSATMPSRARPSSTWNAAVSSASAPARASARPGEPAANGRMMAAITAARVESGPSTSTRLGPNRA